MDKIFTFALAIAVSIGTTIALAISSASHSPDAVAAAQLAADGAFRDGLYVGRLAAESGRSMRPQVGRWSTDRDRAAFTAGYRRGYFESLAAPRGRN